MTFTRILCATDFSPGAEHALRMAAGLATKSRAELVIAYAWQMPPTMYGLEAPLSAGLPQQLVDDGERGLEAAVRDARGAGVSRVSERLLNGVAWTEIVGQLETEPFDLCVIGTHGRSGLARVLLGSVAEKIVRHAPCSVLVVPTNAGTGTFSHVLVPTDFSESAQRALELAPALVMPDGKLTLLHVVEIPIAYSVVPNADFSRTLDARAEGVLADVAAGLAAKTSVRVTPVTQLGQPGAQTLVVLDSDPTIDLVVMGSHGRTGIERAFMGSVAEKVVRHARCPVLIARKGS